MDKQIKTDKTIYIQVVINVIGIIALLMIFRYISKSISEWELANTEFANQTGDAAVTVSGVLIFDTLQTTMAFENYCIQLNTDANVRNTDEFLVKQGQFDNETSAMSRYTALLLNHKYHNEGDCIGLQGINHKTPTGFENIEDMPEIIQRYNRLVAANSQLSDLVTTNINTNYITFTRA